MDRYINLLFLCVAVIPGFYTFPTDETVSANGSSATGFCSNVTVNETESTCSTPATSVLFDGIVPTLTGLDGNMWASQLLTIQTATPSTEITFDFMDTPDYSGVEAVEVVMFNCPERGIFVSAINIHEFDSGGTWTSVGSLNISTISCDTLLRACLDSAITLPTVRVEFELGQGADQAYLAEVTFVENDSCPAPVTIPDSGATTLNAPLTTAGEHYLGSHHEFRTSAHHIGRVQGFMQ
jgi:hypothetical protein